DRERTGVRAGGRACRRERASARLRRQPDPRPRPDEGRGGPGGQPRPAAGAGGGSDSAPLLGGAPAVRRRRAEARLPRRAPAALALGGYRPLRASSARATARTVRAIEKFDRLARGYAAHDYADPARYAARRADVALALGPAVVPGSTVLDLACGDANMAEPL